MSLPGFDDQAGRGEAAVDQMGPVLDLLQLALDDADQAVQVGGGALLGGARPRASPCPEENEAAEAGRALFIWGHPPPSPPATASSSRSIAWRAGTWQDQPCRRISFRVPSTVYPT